MLIVLISSLYLWIVFFYLSVCLTNIFQMELEIVFFCPVCVDILRYVCLFLILMDLLETYVKMSSRDSVIFPSEQIRSLLVNPVSFYFNLLSFTCISRMQMYFKNRKLRPHLFMSIFSPFFPL